MSSEYVIIKGVSDRYTGYATNTSLTGDSGYCEYKGFFFDLENSIASNVETIEFSNNYKRSFVKAKPKFQIRSLWFGYPGAALNYEDYFNDVEDNNLLDVLNSNYVWICNDHTANGSDTRLNLVPTSETSYTTKNRLVVINSVEVVKDGDLNFYIQIEMEYSSV